MKIDKYALKIFIQNRILNHVLFWAFSYYILLNIFSKNGSYKTIDFLYTGIFIFTLIIPVLLNLYLLFPQFLLRKKYLFYAICIILCLFGFSYFNYLLFDKLIDHLILGYYFISYYDFGDLLKFFAVFLILTSLIKLSKEWFQLSEYKQKLIETKKEKAEIELKALRSQVNPHFLFNSLNVLYSLAIKHSKDTPDAIIKLSDILRYVIYDSNRNFVNLSAEVKLIKDYLSLQKYRIDDNSKVDFIIDVKKDIQIAPMLFLPLVENSFKHGIKGDIDKTFVKIVLKSDNNVIYFEILNNKGLSDEIEENEKGGIGISNIRHRLSLIYPKNHKFDIEENEKSFNVKMIIYP